LKYLRARAKGTAPVTPVQALNQMRRGQLRYNKTAKHSVGSLAGRGALEALDLTTGIPTLMHTIKGMRAHRGDVQTEVQPRYVAGLMGGLRGGGKGRAAAEAGAGRRLSNKEFSAIEEGSGRFNTWMDEPPGSYVALAGAAGASVAGMYGIDRFFPRWSAFGPPRGVGPATPEQEQKARAKYLHDAEQRSGRKFTPRDRFNAQVDLLLKMGKISSGKARHAKAWAASAPTGGWVIQDEFQRVADAYFGPDYH
jgi:hypothetical protein